MELNNSRKICSMEIIRVRPYVFGKSQQYPGIAGVSPAVVLQRAVGKALPMDVMETGHNFWPHPDNNMYL
jgi:hypothetical protein